MAPRTASEPIAQSLYSLAVLPLNQGSDVHTRERSDLKGMAFFLFTGQVNELLAPESLTRIPRIMISLKLSVLVIFAAVHVLGSDELGALAASAQCSYCS